MLIKVLDNIGPGWVAVGPLLGVFWADYGSPCTDNF